MSRSFFWSTGWVCLCVCAALSQTVKVRADTNPLEACVDRLDDAQVAQLSAFTEQSLADQRLGSSLWFSGWMAFNVTNVALGAWQMAVVDNQIEFDGWLVSTISASTFLLGAAIVPPPGLYAARRMGKLPASSPAQRREKLRQGLRLLDSAAQAEERNTGWLAHLAGLLLSGLSTGYMYIHNRHTDDRSELHTWAWVQFGATLVSAEATIWTVPRRARRDVAQLREQQCSETRPRPAPTAVAPSLSVAFAGSYAGLRLRF
jgi:hypothetical protein